MVLDAVAQNSELLSIPGLLHFHNVANNKVLLELTNRSSGHTESSRAGLYPITGTRSASTVLDTGLR